MQSSLRATSSSRNNGNEISKPDSRLLPFLKRIMTPSTDGDVPAFASSRQIIHKSASGGPDQVTVQTSTQVTAQEPSTPHKTIGPRQSGSRSKIKAPVWEERQTARSFSLQAFDDNPNREPFEGAHEALRIMNPRHYQMPFGSRVVSIKCGTLQNIYKSLQHGVWACPTNVTKRLEQLFTNRASDAKDKVLFLFSVSGSKQYCGFAEVQGYDPHMVTQFPGDDQIYQGSFILRWVYCKFVSFDAIRKVDLTHQGDSVTQMWNGMHYNEELGRQVIQAYIEAPHFDNVLACHPASQVEKTYRRRGNGHPITHIPQRPHHNASAVTCRSSIEHTAQTISTNGAQSTAHAENANKENKTPPAELLSRLRRLHPAEDGSLAPPPAFGSLQGEIRPKVQTMQVVVNGDGTIRPATMSEAAIQLPHHNPQPLAFMSTPSAAVPTHCTPAQTEYERRGIYPFNSLPIAAKAMQTHHLAASRSLEMPRQAVSQPCSCASRQTFGSEAHSWPVQTQQLSVSAYRTPHYTTRYMQQIGSMARHTEEDARRFQAARQAIEAENRQAVNGQSLTTHYPQSGVDTSMVVDRALGWVDDLVASPEHSPSRRM